jgi:hypothetical protein
LLRKEKGYSNIEQTIDFIVAFRNKWGGKMQWKK